MQRDSTDMASGSGDGAGRRAALEGLRFHRNQSQAFSPLPLHTSATPTSSASFNPSLPPAQSRDASRSSRYFPSTPSHTGNVLVPNSSPLGPETYTFPPAPSHQLHTSQSFQIPGFLYHGSYNTTEGSYDHDSFAASSGFLSNVNAFDASTTRFSAANGRAYTSGDLGDIHGGTRKRVRSSGDSTNVPTSPSSPEVQRPGQRRRTTATTRSPSPSEDSLPETVTSAPPKRIIRGRPNSHEPPSSDASQSINSDERFTRFKVTMPLHPIPMIKAAWDEAKHDVKLASQLLQDPSWSPKLSITPSPTAATKAETGRVKELDEAKTAERAAIREKGKKSMIYLNRMAVENSKPLPTHGAVPARRSSPPPAKRPSPPPSPDIAFPRRKRTKKAIVESDSDEAYEDSDGDRGRRSQQTPEEDIEEIRALSYFNGASVEALQELTGCTLQQANHILSLRPFDTVEDLKIKLGQGKKKSGPGGVSPRMFSDCTTIFAGYGSVDSVLADCERIGAQLRASIVSWTIPAAETNGKGKQTEDPDLNNDEFNDGALAITALVPAAASKDYLLTQPSLLSDAIKLKDYQLTGVSWLRLLYRKKLSCILADEMGLGKTAQIISFFASLKEQGAKGPHLIVVPSSTLENWCREFARFAPSIVVQTYYAGKEERPLLRQTLQDTMRSKNKEGWEVLITTYNLAQGDDKDRKFFRRIEWDCCVFDEGHVLKNFQSQRYQALLKYESRWRVLLTGTPLQNNLQELVSLMNFILPDQFTEHMESMRAIFKVKGDSKVTMLSQERVSRAKKMMTPFVLRRRKDQVLKDLPKKMERIEWCEMTPLQTAIYRNAIQQSRKTVLSVDPPPAELQDSILGPPGKSTKVNAKKKKTGATKPHKMYLENSSNVLMDLRKAALHPMLFRKRFTDESLTSIARLLLKEPDFKKRKAVFEYVKEDMEVMTDAELQIFVASYKSTRKFLQDEGCYLEAGKISTLLRLLLDYKSQGRRVLIFSQFTQVLDILQTVLKLKDYKYLLLTGATAVDVRQSLVDEFTEDESISVFLLSTKAGGMGINLTAASVVIMFDQDFNPHNDRQAQDRAYRIGQKRDVDVVKLITRNTIEEDMLRLGQTKLALDEAVAGDAEDDSDKGEGAADTQMKASLMSVLRKQFEQELDGEKATTETADS